MKNFLITKAFCIIVVLVLTIALIGCASSTPSDSTTETTITEDSCRVVICHECGTEYIEPHTFYAEEFDTENHTAICEECGIQITQPHTLVDIIYDEEHTLECECGYVAKLHYSVTYEHLDENTHKGTCSCGYTITEEHEWMQFECYDCEVEISSTVYGLVEEIYRNRITLLTADDNYKFYNDTEIECGEGDFVCIKFVGNTAINIEVIVDYSVINNLDEFQSNDTIQLETICEIDYEYDDIIVALENDKTLVFSNYVVYDFVYTDIEDKDFLSEEDTIIFFQMDGVTHILDIY